MPRKPSFKPPLRDQLAKNNVADRWWASSFGKEPMAQSEIAPKRAYTKSGNESEADVNAKLREWFGSRTEIVMYRNNRGSVQDHAGHWVRYGVGPNGASDWIGYVIKTVTPEMVGQRVAIFAAVEAKAPGKKAEEAQARFIDAVKEDGGLAGVARSAEEASEILNGS